MKIEYIAPLFLAFFSVAATTNAQLVGFGFIKIGPKILIMGDRVRPVQFSIDEVSVGTILPGTNWSQDFARKTWAGGQYVTISAKVCASSHPMDIPVWAPVWANDPAIVGGLVLDEAYLQSRPDKKSFDERIKKMRRVIKTQIAHRAMEGQLNDWLEKVKYAIDFKMPGTTCENPSSVQGRRVWIGPHPFPDYSGGSYYYGAARWTIPIYIEGTPDKGYKFRIENPTQIVQ